jgi:uncharacterized protein YicC (UPF0701 family)
MTGYARVRKAAEGGEIVVSLKSVNHRGLDMHFHMSSELDSLENAIRGVIKSGIARGHVQIHVGVTRGGEAGGAPLNRALLEAWIGAFREAAATYRLDSKPDLNAAFRVPGMLATESDGDVGRNSRRDLAACEEVVSGTECLPRARRRPSPPRCAPARGSVRPRDRMADPQRLFPPFRSGFASGWQICCTGPASSRSGSRRKPPSGGSQRRQRELIRLKTHAAQLVAILSGAGEMGKRLDFLLQEMNREATRCSEDGRAGAD